MTRLTKKTILVLLNRAMGDAVIGLSGVQFMRKLYPDAHIIYGVPEWISPLFKNAHIEADEVMPISLSGAASWFSLYWELKKKNVELIHEMFQSGRTAKFFKLYSFLTGAKYTFHNHHLKSSDVIDQGIIKPVIQRHLDGIATYYAKMSPSYLDYEPKMIVKGNLGTGGVILGVVATRETKMWELKKYVELSNRLLLKGINVTIALSSSKQDTKIEQTLIELGLPNEVEILKSSLANLPVELSKEKIYIGNDTGLKHICIALGLKSITLFGPEPPLEWHPYNTERHKYFYKDNLDCRTTVAHYCGLSTCDSMICLNKFTVEDIEKEYEQLSATP